jgi:TatD DNase family protein
MQVSTSAGSKKSSGSSTAEELAVLDAHCHVDLFERPADVIALAERAQIRTIAVTNRPSHFETVSRLIGPRRYLRVAAGLHPELATAHRGELDLLWRALDRTRYVGEVGLDYSRTDVRERVGQREVFEAILRRCDDVGGKVLSVHSRRAAGDVVSLVGSVKNCAVILHWFSGAAKDAEQASAAGLYFSINVSMVKGKGADLVARLPREQILTESDGPFVMWRGRPADPSSTGAVIDALSQLWGVSPLAARTQVLKNLRSVLDRAGAMPAVGPAGKPGATPSDSHDVPFRQVDS